MRLVIVNPNTTAAITAMLVAEARQVAGAGTAIAGVTAPFGVAAIESAAEAAIAGHAVAQAFADAGAADAGIVAAFADPGLAGARALMRCPVVGMGEASMLTACALGERFAVVTAGRTARAIEKQVRDHGLAARFAGVRAIDASLLDVAREQDTFAAAIVHAASEAVAADRADAVILGGAVFVGMAGRVAARVAVPVLDPIRCAVLQAEALARLRLEPARASARGATPGKASTGLSQRLAARLRGEPDDGA